MKQKGNTCPPPHTHFLHNQLHVTPSDVFVLSLSHQSLSLRAQNYLYDQSLWNSVCIEPPNVVAWNIYFFSVLLVISVVEMVLASLQIINGFFGCLCGLCEGK